MKINPKFIATKHQVHFQPMHRSSSKAPAKRSQHANATNCDIVGRNMQHAFGHRVAMCCDMLGVVGSSLKMVKFEPTTPNMSQHIATRWRNARNMLRPRMSQYVTLACCNRLGGAYTEGTLLKCTIFLWFVNLQKKCKTSLTSFLGPITPTVSM